MADRLTVELKNVRIRYKGSRQRDGKMSYYVKGEIDTGNGPELINIGGPLTKELVLEKRYNMRVQIGIFNNALWVRLLESPSEVDGVKKGF